MQRVLLMTARLTTAAWVGAAVLFVVTGTREVTRVEGPLNQSTIRDALVAVRFPAYYAFGFLLVAAALLCAVLLQRGTFRSAMRRWLVLGLLSATLLMMLADYFWIYRELVEMITPPGRARPAEFVTYHKASKWINAADIGLCFFASVLLNWPAGIKNTES